VGGVICSDPGLAAPARFDRAIVNMEVARHRAEFHRAYITKFDG